MVTNDLSLSTLLPVLICHMESPHSCSFIPVPSFLFQEKFEICGLVRVSHAMGEEILPMYFSRL